MAVGSASRCSETWRTPAGRRGRHGGQPAPPPRRTAPPSSERDPSARSAGAAAVRRTA